MTVKRIIGFLGLLIAAIVAVAAAVPYFSSPVCAAGCNQRATGHGTVNRADGKRQFSFNAIKQDDGTVKGNAILQSASRDFRGNINVTCMELVGNKARIGGIIKNTNDAGSEDNTVVFEVTDNGEPGKGKDTISGVAFSPKGSPVPNADYCRNSLAAEELPTMPIDGGNIQVSDCPKK